MNEDYKPSADFVARVMGRVHSDPLAVPSLERLALSPSLRYLLAGGGALFGLLRALPAF